MQSVERTERIKKGAEWSAAGLASLLFGASFGWNYGVDNQVVYMLGSLKLLNPALYAKDWFATQTTHYHPAFKVLAAALIGLSRRGLVVGITQTLVIAVGMMGLYFMIRAMVERGRALPAFLLLVALASMTRTRGPCATYVFDYILQPSTLGSAAFFVSVAFFMRERWLASGIALATSGLFHANYLILFFGTFLLTHLLLGKKDLKLRATRQLGPPLVVLLLFAPMILGTALSKDAKAAQELYATVRAPHHFVIQGRETDFLPLAGWTLLGLGAASPLTRNRTNPIGRLSALLAALLLVIWGGVGLSTVAGLRSATQLFAWRIVPHTELLLMALSAAAALRILVEPGLYRRYGAPQLALVFGGIGTLSLWAAKDKKALAIALVALLVLVACVVVVYAVRTRRPLKNAPESSRNGQVWQGALLVMSLLVAGGVLSPELSDFRRRSNVLRGALGENELSLYAWMRDASPIDAVFLTPPDNETARFHGQRAIVVDWKSNPVVPGEMLVWAERLEAVTGRKLRSHKDLEGYTTLDEARALSLRERYGVDFLVVRRGAERALSKFKTAYSNGAYVVVDIRG